MLIVAGARDSEYCNAFKAAPILVRPVCSPQLTRSVTAFAVVAATSKAIVIRNLFLIVGRDIKPRLTTCRLRSRASHACSAPPGVRVPPRHFGYRRFLGGGIHKQKRRPEGGALVTDTALLLTGLDLYPGTIETPTVFLRQVPWDEKLRSHFCCRIDIRIVLD